MVQIRVSAFGRHKNTPSMVEATHPWPEGTFLQAGEKGLVFLKNGRNYKTAFVEGSNDQVSFFRGEGETISEAETKAWEKYLTYTTCQEHVWETRGYTNGGGFCANCGKFGSKVFTGEQLNQYCDVCNVGTTWGNTLNKQKVLIWGCQEHLKSLEKEYIQFLETQPEESLTEKEKFEIRNWYSWEEDEGTTLTPEQLGEALEQLTEHWTNNKKNN